MEWIRVAMRTDPASILIVDHQPSVCRLITKQLSERGFDCHVATDGQTARERLGTQAFKLLITGVEVRQGVVEVEPATGAVVQAFTSSAMVQMFRLAQSAPAASWSGPARGKPLIQGRAPL